MARTDWVFPETGYTCEQDKRALLSKEINGLPRRWAGASDNRNRAAEPILYISIRLRCIFCQRIRRNGPVDRSEGVLPDTTRQIWLPGLVN